MNVILKQLLSASEKLLSCLTNIITVLRTCHFHTYFHRCGETLYGSEECPGLEEDLKKIEQEIVPLAALENSLAKEYEVPAELDIDSVEVFDKAKSRTLQFGKDDPHLEENVWKLDKLHQLRVKLCDLQQSGCGISCCKRGSLHYLLRPM
ncbi:hypothetical protein EDD18DRAFT_1104895 [Armillaria luteobubalina]|uniref:Uncharacterized protein n=1 Tax=Armillaria luteobubalina TaxID=153913 RepID=A0AA39Q991_9AGAR|nr:hypothetical protein EDD18DRAFT_1104895 [Armillaria luteobubalina]